MKTSFLTLSKRRSPLRETQGLKGARTKHKLIRRDLAIALPLTSLIDAFSIIVIYLLIGTQNSSVETELAGKINLPQASHSQGIEKTTAVLRIEQGQYFLNNMTVAKSDLGVKLSELKKRTFETNKNKGIKDEVELIIQADTEMKFADLDPLLKAGSQVGIEKLKFAVVPKP